MIGMGSGEMAVENMPTKHRTFAGLADLRGRRVQFGANTA